VAAVCKQIQLMEAGTVKKPVFMLGYLT